jgi:hypothetical protein
MLMWFGKYFVLLVLGVLAADAGAVTYDLSVGSINSYGQYTSNQHGVALTVSSSDGAIHLATGLGVDQGVSQHGVADNVNFENDAQIIPGVYGIDSESMYFAFEREVILKGVSFSGLTSSKESIELFSDGPREIFRAAGGSYFALSAPQSLNWFVMVTEGKGVLGGGANVRVLSLDIEVPVSVPLSPASWFFVMALSLLVSARSGRH